MKKNWTVVLSLAVVVLAIGLLTTTAKNSRQDERLEKIEDFRARFHEERRTVYSAHKGWLIEMCGSTGDCGPFYQHTWPELKEAELDKLVRKFGTDLKWKAIEQKRMVSDWR